MKIAFFETTQNSTITNRLQKYNPQITFFEKNINEYSNLEDFEIISIFINSKITKEILDKLPNLKYIQTRSTGYDHIDIVECYKRGIVVSNVKGYAGPAVGEFAFSLLFEAIRHTYKAINRVKNNNFYYKDIQGVEIYNKTIGILGLGAIGTQIAKIAKGFGAKTIGFSRTKTNIVDTHTSSLDEVLKSDFLFIALPLTPQTKHLLNENNFHNIKSKVIINIARDEILSKYVYQNFNGIIASDVTNDTNLLQKENIIITPHMAYYTKEALRRILNISLDNMCDFLDGKKPRNCLLEECKKEYECKSHS